MVTTSEHASGDASTIAIATARAALLDLAELTPEGYQGTMREGSRPVIGGFPSAGACH